MLSHQLPIEMNKLFPTILAVLVVLGTVAVGPVAAGLAAPPADSSEERSNGPTAAIQGQDNETTPTNDSDTPPGARLAGVVAVGDAEAEAAVEDRAFGIRVAQAASDGDRADVVGDRLSDVESRLAALEATHGDLRAARDNGSMSEGEYRARAAKLAAQSQALERAANQSATVASGLPATLLESRGIDVTAIRTLADRADQLGGEEVAAIARSIAGGAVGTHPAGDRTPFDGNVPGPDGAGPATGTAGTPGTDQRPENGTADATPADGQ